MFASATRNGALQAILVIPSHGNRRDGHPRVDEEGDDRKPSFGGSPRHVNKLVDGFNQTVKRQKIFVLVQQRHSTCEFGVVDWTENRELLNL